MKQLLIVTQNTYADGTSGAVTNANDLSTLKPGAIAFFKAGGNAVLPTTGQNAETTFADNFGIALGQSSGPAFVIPEVDFHTLKVVKSTYNSTLMQGTNFTATVTIPTVASTDLGKTFTIVLVKKGAVPHERNTWTATETIFDTTTQTASVLATKLGDYFKRMAETGSLNVTVSVSGAAITITGMNFEQWEIKAADDLPITALGTVTNGVFTLNGTYAKPAVQDAAWVKDLAQQCAAGKGFTDTYRDGDTIYPGYPENVPNGYYTVFTLRFAVGRKSAKTRDERVSQLVHIAVIHNTTTGGDGGLISKITTLLGLS